MNIRCPKFSPCEELTPPYENLSTEAPDQDLFIGTYFGNPQFPPPLGRDWQSWWCMGICTSSISQAEADLCAVIAQQQCLVDPPNIPDINIFLFNNRAQTAHAHCPDGSEFSYTVPAGKFVNSSQVMADRMAFSYAQEQANSEKVCLSDLPGVCCVGSAYSQTVRATTNNHIVRWEVDGDLPDGLELQSIPFPQNDTEANQAQITGTPTTAGTFTFTITATDQDGNFMAKPYTLCAAAISPTNSTLPDATIGSAYSVTVSASACTSAFFAAWTITAGGLPDGLSLNSVTGEISGIPTGLPASYQFTVGLLLNV